MKKLLLLSIASVFMFSVAGCKKKEEKDPDVKTIGIAKIIAHNSLNDAENGIIDELKAQNMKVAFDLQNANGDINIATSIANKFKSNKIDIAVGIATPMTVALRTTMANTPIVFTAVTDPVQANLAISPTQGKPGITGVVDTIPIREQIMEFKKFYDFKTLGIIYTTSESNSVSMYKTTQEVAKELGIKLVAKTISTPSEVKQAAESLVNVVDAFYCFTDNSIATAMSALTDTAKTKHKPVFGGDITPTLNGGVVYALGFSYYEMGRMAGKQIIEILNGKKPEELPILSLNDPKYYNVLLDLDTAKSIGIKVDEELIKKAKYIIENGKLTEKTTETK